jgi:hypothetical protein
MHANRFVGIGITCHNILGGTAARLFNLPPRAGG